MQVRTVRTKRTLWALAAIAIGLGVCVYAFFWLPYLSGD